MSYIEGSLLKNEEVVFLSKPHWVVFVPSMIVVLLAILIWIFGPFYFKGSIDLNVSMLRSLRFSDLLALFAVAIAVYSSIKATVVYYASEYGITNKRIVMKRGFLQRDVLELFIRRLEAVNISQTIMGRLCGYGTLIVVGTGGTRDYFTDIPYPTHFRRLIQQQMDRLVAEDRHVID